MTASLGQRRSHTRAGAAAINATVDDAVAEIAAHKAAEHASAKTQHQAEEAARHRFTRDELVGAKGVRTRTRGWARVVKLNAKSVTVETGYSWTDRVRFEDVLEVLR